MTAGKLLGRGGWVVRAAEKLPVLKGHGFSRAVKRAKWAAALAAEGMQPAENAFPRRLKPRIFSRCLAARLKPRPFKACNLPKPTAFFAAYAVAALLAAATLCGAQEHSPSAHDLAQHVDRHYNQLHSLKAGFIESYEGLGIKRTESGTLLLLKPGRMKWEYSLPAGKLFLLDGKYAWFYSRGDSQVQRIPAKELDDLRSPLRFMLGHTKLEKELSNLKLVPCSGSNCHFWKLTGQPRGQENRVARLTLAVTAEGAIAGIEIEEADGALTRFTFTGEQPNAAIPAETFHFTPPYGVPVVDALPPV